MHTHSQTPQIYSLARTVAILMLCIVAIAAIACGDSDEPEATVEVQAAPTTASTATPVQVVEVKSDEEHDSDDSTSGSSEEAKSEEEDGEHSSASSSEATDDDEDSVLIGDNDVVSNTNQITGGDLFDWSPNQALKDAEPLNVVEWTQRPTLSLGALDASGVVKEGATLFNPMFGEGATFAIYHVNYDDEPMVVLLPNLGPMSIWETDLTVAEMDHEFEGANFTFTAYSPLFFDATPSDMQLRVYGFDSGGNPALLAISEIGFGDDQDQASSGSSASSEDEEPADGDEDGEHSSASSSDVAKDDPEETKGSNDYDIVSNTNQITGGYVFEWSENQALKDADPLDVVTWESGPTLGLGELYGEATIDDDAILFDPFLGDGAALAVYHVNYDDDPMIVLLPSLGPTMIWETDLTVAEMDYEIDGQTLTFRAYSPLFFDGNASDIKLRIYGYDADNNPALLAISDIQAE